MPVILFACPALVVVASGARLSPSTITIDFERALMAACAVQFRDAHMMGYLFHFKQAI
jgi:hypothetical protein